MIIALPATHHEHLADALVRDLGFKRRHVDAPLREFLLALDPFVDSGVAMANMGPSPRLSSKLEQMGGNDEEGRWTRLLNPPRPGSVPDRVAAEVKRLLDVVRDELPAVATHPEMDRDVVVVGVDTWEQCKALYGPHLVALSGRYGGDANPDHWIADGGIMGEQEAIVRYVRELRNGYTAARGVVHSDTPAEETIRGVRGEDLPGLAEDALPYDLVPGPVGGYVVPPDPDDPRTITLNPEAPPDPDVEIVRNEDGSITAYVPDGD